MPVRKNQNKLNITFWDFKGSDVRKHKSYEFKYFDFYYQHPVSSEKFKDNLV